MDINLKKKRIGHLWIKEVKQEPKNLSKANP